MLLYISMVTVWRFTTKLQAHLKQFPYNWLCPQLRKLLYFRQTFKSHQQFNRLLLLMSLVILIASVQVKLQTSITSWMSSCICRKSEKNKIIFYSHQDKISRYFLADVRTCPPYIAMVFIFQLPRMETTFAPSMVESWMLTNQRWVRPLVPWMFIWILLQTNCQSALGGICWLATSGKTHHCSKGLYLEINTRVQWSPKSLRNCFVTLSDRF